MQKNAGGEGHEGGDGDEEGSGLACTIQCGPDADDFELKPLVPSPNQHEEIKRDHGCLLLNI